jgi:hypothetical protein
MVAKFERRYVVATKYLQRLRGGSQPVVVEASDGLLYVVKFCNNIQGANVAFNESIGTELYCALKLAVPFWKPLIVTDSFLDRNPDCWMYTKEGRLRPASGPCFASRFMDGKGKVIFEFPTRNQFKRISNCNSFWLSWMIDICADHADNRQALFVESTKGRLKAYFIDQGHLFGGPDGTLHPRIRASRYLDGRIYPELSLNDMLGFQNAALHLDQDCLWNKVKLLPNDWKTGSAIEAFLRCLDRLSSAEELRKIFDIMRAEIEWSREVEDYVPKIGRREPDSVLFPWIQAGTSKQRPVRGHGRDRNCA